MEKLTTVSEEDSFHELIDSFISIIFTKHLTYCVSDTLLNDDSIRASEKTSRYSACP